MKTLQERTASMNALLRPYAIPIQGMLGRVHSEEEDDTRFPFQRDRDRIIHTQAFRRLKGKTQVFVTGEGDHYRTRLTHTMEVAQISRDIARTLSLNEDLAECIALAHDLGHPPFGHAGEETLNAWMQAQGSGFEHNIQSYRIVTVLEKHADLYPGLNLNQEVLEGLLKHRTPHDHPEAEVPRAPSMEAQLVNIADEIAYTGHDCDDGLREGLFTIRDINSVELARDAHTRAESRGTSLRGSLIHLLVHDLYSETERRIADLAIRDMESVYAAHEPIVAFSVEMQTKITELRSFLWDHMYMQSGVLERSSRGKEIILTLCTRFMKSPTEKILALEKHTNAGLIESIKDYVAGMTDEYATKLASA